MFKGPDIYFDYIVEVILLHLYNPNIYHNKLSSNLSDYFSLLIISYCQKNKT